MGFLAGNALAWLGAVCRRSPLARPGRTRRHPIGSPADAAQQRRRFADPANSVQYVKYGTRSKRTNPRPTPLELALCWRRGGAR